MRNGWLIAHCACACAHLWYAAHSSSDNVGNGWAESSFFSLFNAVGHTNLMFGTVGVDGLSCTTWAVFYFLLNSLQTGSICSTVGSHEAVTYWSDIRWVVPAQITCPDCIPQSAADCEHTSTVCMGHPGPRLVKLIATWPQTHMESSAKKEKGEEKKVTSKIRSFIYFSCATVAASTFARRCNYNSLSQRLVQLFGNGKVLEI